MPRRFLFRLFAAVTTPSDHVADGELIRRFVATGDSAAFELLVRRHADAVWAAGRRILGNDADAEDVFQATFLALVRKAASVRGACIGGFLHRVAVNAALKLKASRERERPEEHELRSLTQPARLERDELAAVVQQELARLPDRYRLPVLLCDLEGHSHAEAAKTLGWPIGSVSGRLSRAHGILRDRLTRRGFAPPAALLVAVAAPSSVTHAATAVALGTASVSPIVVALTQGVLSAMRTAKLKLAAAVLAASGMIGLAGVGTVYVFAQRPAPRGSSERPVPDKADPIKIVGTGTDITAFPDLLKGGEKVAWNDPKRCPLIVGPDDVPVGTDDTPYIKLLKARVNILRQVIQQEARRYQAGQSDGTATADHTDRLVTAAIELELDPKKKIPWLRERVMILHALEAMAEARVQAARGTMSAVLVARERRLAAETDLLLFTTVAEKAKGGR